MMDFYRTALTFFTFQNTLILLFLGISLFVGFISSRKDDYEGFMIGNRKLGIFSAAISIAVSDIGTITLLVYTAFVYRYGISCLWIYIGILTGRILFTFFALHLRSVARGKKFLTLGDYFACRYGRKAALCVVGVLFLWFFGQLSIQFVGVSKVLSELTGAPVEISIGIIFAVCILYLVSGGFKSLIKTDIFQFFILLIVLSAILVSISCGLTVPIHYYDLFNAGIVTIAAFFIFGIFQQFAAQDNWQRVFAMKDDNIVKQSFIISGFIEFGVALLFTYLGLIARTRFAGIDPALAVLKTYISLVPPYMTGFVAILFYGAILSTADTYLFTLSVNISNDFLQMKKSDYKKIVLTTRISIFIIGLCGVALALLYRDMNNLTLIFKAIGLVIAPIVIFSWINKGCKKAIITTVIITVFTICGFALKGFIKTDLFVISIMGGFIVYASVLLLNKLFYKLYEHFKPEEQLESLEEVE